MDGKSNNSLNIKDFKESSLIPAFTTKEDYSEFMITNFGSGIPLWKNDYAEKSKDRILLLIPPESYFLDAGLPLSKQNEYIKKCLFDDYALQVLFHKELDVLNKKLGNYTEAHKLSGEDFLTLQKKEMGIFYNRRRKLLCDLDSVQSLVEFIRQQINGKEIQKASAFLSWCGICGVFFKAEQFDYLLFDPSSHSVEK